MPKVNFANTEDTNFDAVPAGTYTVTITDGEMRESGPNSKNPGSEYINWEFTIAEGEFEGRKIWTNTTLLEHALFALKGLLGATGKYNVDDELDFEIEDVIGSKIKIVVGQREYNGDTQNTVKKFKQADDNSTEGSLLP